MKLRLFLRRLTISAPRMAVRSALPWPFRWASAAIVLGFCAAIALWAFEFGRDIAGLDHGAKEELASLRVQLVTMQDTVAKMQEERDKAQMIANTAGTLVNVGKAAEEKLMEQVKQLQAQNQTLRDDLGFFERLIPSTGGESVAIRGIQADIQNGKELKWQTLVIQANKAAPEFNGRLELSFSGTLGGKPWATSLPGGSQSFTMRQYGRLQGVLEVPAQVVIKTVVAKVLEGSVLRATQTLKM
jgi:DNA-binding protein YbaB